jgi:diguanylate cyclase (GGDEF)-like protein/PAS domain S-box-containing protein
MWTAHFKAIKLSLLVVCLCFTSIASSQPSPDSAPLEKVRFQLKWYAQFQFAGYYAALEQGYYADEGLDVEIIERHGDQDVVDRVVSGQAEYGVGDSGLLLRYADGDPVVALAAIFQHSATVFISLQDSGIFSPLEMADKRVMMGLTGTDKALMMALLASSEVSSNALTIVPRDRQFEQLMSGEVDVISGYVSDQPYYFQERNIRINVVNPWNYGMDFYGDILFTSNDELQNHLGRAARFKRASLRGWQYALENEEELISILHSKYDSKLSVEHLRFEAKVMRGLILKNVIPLGHIDPQRLKAIADTYAGASLAQPLTINDLNEFVYREMAWELELTDEEEDWLAAHPVIKVGIDNNFRPYEWVDENNRYVGFTADYIRRLENKLGVRFNFLKNKSWSEMMAMAERQELDMIASAVRTEAREKFLIFSPPFKASYAVIIDNGQGGYIGNLDNLAGKRVAVEKGFFIQEILSTHYPAIHTLVASNTEEALRMVSTGKADAYVGNAGSANYLIKKHGIHNLRYSGQTQYSSKQSVAVTTKNPELAAIVAKAVRSIPQSEVDELFDHWLGLKVEQGVPASTLIMYGLVFTLLFILVGYWVFRLRREVHFRKLAEMNEQSRSEVLELLTKGAELSAVLDVMARNLERLYPQMICSILLLDREGKRLKTAAAPSLPDFYNDAVNGLVIGENVGSCGTAAYLAEPVVVEDVQQHPYWEKFKGLAQKANLASCWSQPVIGSNSKVLGTLAIYQHKPSMPTDDQIKLIESLANLAALVIETSFVENEMRIAAAAFEAQSGLVITDKNQVILRVNQAFTNITGYSQEELVGQTPAVLKSGRQSDDFYKAMWNSVERSGRWEGELWNKKKNNQHYLEQLCLTAVKDTSGNTTNYVGAIADITQRKEFADKIERLAFYDALTDLPNRRLLLDRLMHAFSSSARSGLEGALLFLDLDEFKTLNDTLGHDVGDLLLKDVADRLLHCVREGDTVARLGGDEFVVLLEGLSNESQGAGAQAEVVAEKILSELGRSYLLNGENYHITASIGVTLFNGHNTSKEELLKQADIAMYQAKKTGRNNARFFDNRMQESINVRVEMVRELKKAIRLRQFQLYYQVQVDRALKPIGAEVLIRWVHPERGIIPPFQFISLAEETGLILSLGEWILETACAQLRAWQGDSLTRDLTLSVNVSARQFRQGDFVAKLKSAVERNDVNPAKLKLELTESLLLENIEETIFSMNALAEMGIQFSLDDFGTGYSSLQYLKRLPLYQLKIDQSFVRDLVGGGRDRSIVRTIVAMAESLNLGVIAEGVETAEQLQCLLSDDCLHFQGYLFSKPVPIEEFMVLLEQKAGELKTLS